MIVAAELIAVIVNRNRQLIFRHEDPGIIDEVMISL